MDPTIPSALRPAAERLRRITGFLTTLCPPDDPRPLFFSRYYHVRRVGWTALWLAERRGGVSLDRVTWLAWAHDLNRWPFAHNSEKTQHRPFNQAADLPGYLARREIEVPPALLEELCGIITKHPRGLSAEGRIVLLSDMATGFIEDSLMAMVGLDLSPEIVPEHIARVLGLPVEEPAFRARVLRLNRRLYERRWDSRLVDDFDAVFRERMAHFLFSHGMGETDPLESDWFEGIRQLVKEQFLRPRLFPYNNEKVGHGTVLRRHLIEPLDERYLDRLTEWDEPELVEFAVREGMIQRDELARFFPDLEYVAREEPEMSFRRRYGLEHQHAD